MSTPKQVSDYMRDMQRRSKLMPGRHRYRRDAGGRLTYLETRPLTGQEDAP